jgi:hypothetical protein
MQSKNFQDAIIEYTARHSNLDERRPYIGLSGIGDCEQTIYDRYFTGQPVTVKAKLKCAIGYDFEAILIGRLKAMGLYSDAVPIVLYDGLVQGHLDGLAGGDLLEIKTIERAAYLPELVHNQAPRLPNRVFYQVQAYMHYGRYERAHVLYLARDTGEIRVVGSSYNNQAGYKIEQKVERLVQAVRAMQRPACTCGHCNGGQS